MITLPRILPLLILLAWFAPGPAAGAGVTVEIFDQNIPTKHQWPDAVDKPTETYAEEAFGFVHAPWSYAETGVRQDRGNPFLFRATAMVPLPTGKVRLLLRARGPAKLWIDDTLAVSLPFPKVPTDGHNPMRTNVLTLGMTRFVAPGDEEKLVEFDSPGGTRRIRSETIVGSVQGKKSLRPELGETLAAIAPAGSDDFTLLAPSRAIPLTDEGWKAYVAGRSAEYDRIETERRHAANAAHEPEIQARHEAARRWVAAHPAPPVPDAPARLTSSGQAPSTGSGQAEMVNPVDRFLHAKLERARAAAGQEKGSVHFYDSVRPLLSERCFTCHSNKPKGGLRLDSLATARQGGKSGKPAITPGDPAHSAILDHVRSADPDEVMPPKGDRLKPQEIALLESWIAQGASWPDEEPAAEVTVAPRCDDLTFIRRVFLDTVGVPPDVADIRAFLADDRKDKRERLIDRLLDDPRWADVWTASWQDWLGENPSLVNGTLNNTGPFRYWLHESFRDHKPMDVFVIELVSMSGSPYGGGPAGFGIAGQNDAPMVAKAGVLASTLLATDMKCARCHDAPFHSSTQADLFHLAAMLARAPVAVPKSSTVPMDRLSAGGRIPLIKATLKPGEAVAPAWSLTSLVPDNAAAADVTDSRVRLGAILTAPQNERFAEVMVNRIWHHFFGQGLVEPLADWEHAQPSHPQLLHWLAREFVGQGYDLRHISRLILTSAAYQRQSITNPKANRLYAAMPKRRASAEQFVDTLFSGFGVAMETETLCIDLDGMRTPDNGVNLGRPRRAWEFAYLSNDRDRPSLSLPRAQAVAEVLTAFGWPGSRQEIIPQRKTAPNILQSALLQNGTMSGWLTRLTDDSAMTRVAIEARSADALVRDVFLRILTREPMADELHDFTTLLAPGFPDRVKPAPAVEPVPHRFKPYVAWSNHLVPESSLQRQREAVEAREGAAPTRRLEDDWRERMEDFLWTLLNSPELVYLP